MTQLSVIHETEDNPLGELAELRFQVDCAQGIDVVADLRIGFLEISFPETIYRIGLSGAYLRLNLEGFKPMIGPRYGDINPIQSNLKQSELSNRTGKISAAISGMLGKVPTISGEAAFSAETSWTSEKSSSVTHNGIRALANTTWRLENARRAGEAIESSLLTGQKLISLQLTKNGNRFFIGATIDIAPSEIIVSSKTGKRAIRQINRDRIIQILATRSIYGRAGLRLEEGSRMQISTCTQVLDIADEH